MNTKHHTPKYSVRFLRSENRWVICPAQHGVTKPMTFKKAKKEVFRRRKTVSRFAGWYEELSQGDTP